jgi:iron complex transport system permease protein
MLNKKRNKVYLFSILSLGLVWVLALAFGSTSGSWSILIDLRLPRVVLATVIGMGLAVSGVVLQVLFSNPLCEPYTLGISSGSAVGAVIGSSLGLSWNMGGLAGAAFLGALSFSGVLFAVSNHWGERPAVLLLTGVMLGFLGNSFVALWIVLFDSNGIQNTLVWLFGDLSRARMSGAVFTGVVALPLMFGVFTQARKLDAFLLGEEGASALGVDIQAVRKTLIALTSVLVSLCVSAGGVIGFIGLLVPHLVRRGVGSIHYHLIPISALWGASLLVLADLLSRALARPYELPVGVVTALGGAPVFLWVMLRRSRSS